MKKHGISDLSRVLVFFDDHQNELKRLKQALKAGFQDLIFEDNYDTGTGDHYSFRQICDQFYIRGEFQIGEDIKPLDPGSVASIVRYGTTNLSLINEATGYSLVYSQLYPFEGLQNYTPGIIHHVRLTGLHPSTQYYYQCGDPSIAAMSSTHSFKTMPAPGYRSYPERIAIVSDLGLTYNTTTTVDHVRSNQPNLIVLVGDISYANLYLTNGTGADCYSCSFLDSSMKYMEPVVLEILIMVIEGNHEIELQAENKTFVSYNSRFAFPSEESGSNSKFYYSFNAGGIYFVMHGAYTFYNKSGDQYKWLERELVKLDRNVTPWLIATWHSSWYSTYKARYREAECMRVAMEELLYSYSIDIIFNGHIHAYERSNCIYDYSLDPCGPVHITIGYYTKETFILKFDYLLFIIHDVNLHSNPDEVADVKYVNRDQLKEILISKKQQKVKANQVGTAVVGTSDAHRNIHMHVANYMHRVSDMDFTTAWEQNDMGLIQYWLSVHHKNNHKRIQCL